jgi:putative sterol carrier protein
MTDLDRATNALVHLAKRLESRVSQGNLAPFTKTLQFELSDLGTAYILRFQDGVLRESSKGPGPKPDLRIIAKSDDLINLLEGKNKASGANLSGKFDIKGAGLSRRFWTKTLFPK